MTDKVEPARPGIRNPSELVRKPDPAKFKDALDQAQAMTGPPPAPPSPPPPPGTNEENELPGGGGGG